jgi:hypothetical protein
MAKEELKWQNIDADDLPAAVKKSFDAMVEAEATFKADLEKLLKAEGHMPEDKFLVMSRKGKRLGASRSSRWTTVLVARPAQLIERQRSCGVWNLSRSSGLAGYA